MRPIKLERAGFCIDRDMSVPMRDGTMLAADIYRPDDRQPHPVLLVRTPYNKARTALAQLYIDGLRAMSRGYVVVLQDVRGRFASQGTFLPFFQELEDGFDSVEWCATQPWSTGAVGMYGASYVGAVQWLAAIAQPPHLKAIVPMLTSSDYYEGWTYQGGALQWGFLATWVPLMLASERLWRQRNELPDFEERWRQLIEAVDHTKGLLDTVPLGDLPFAREFAPYYLEWVEHESRDTFWRAISIQDRHDRVQVPALNVGGWYDIFQAGTIRNFTGVRELGATSEARRGSRLLMGPWNHSTPTSSVVGSVEFGIASSQHISPLGYDLDEELLRFFDYWLKGVPNGFAAESPVKFFVTGSNEWRHAANWPPPDVELTRYYLHSAGRANTAAGNGTLSATEPGHEPADAYEYDPGNPVPTCGGQLCCSPSVLPSGAFDQREIELRPDVLVFSTPPLLSEVEVAGPVTLVLFAVSSAPDTDFTAKLVDTEDRGFARNLVDGIVRARYREGTDSPRPITPGVIHRYRVELGDVANVFKQGHRIVVEVSSSNFPRFSRNPNTGGSLGSETQMRIAAQTVYHDHDHPSHLVLPVIGGGELHTPS